jgi:NAD(P)H-dependent FMN reductase
MAERPYRIPVLLGTIRKEARSAPVAQLVASRLAEQTDVETQLIYPAALGLAADDEGPSIKDPAFADLIDQADGLVIVAPEYNHGYPASLKHALDTNYSEYVHKPVGLVGVSTGVLGGARMIENLLPVLRAVGLVAIQRDVTVGNVATTFDGDGELQDPVVLRRLDGMLTELRWMAATLRNGREAISARSDRQPTAGICPDCAAPTNHHASVIDEQSGGAVVAVHSCPLCGRSRRSSG